MEFLQKPLTWFSKFYLRVQSKIAEEKILLFFFSEFFRILSEIFFGLLTKRLLEVFKIPFYVSRGTVSGFNFFLKFWIVLYFLQKPLAWFSKFYLRVQSKNCGRISSFRFSFQNFFSNFERKNFSLLAKKLPEVVKTTLCVCRRTIFGLKVFSKVLNRSGFSAQIFGMVLKLLSSCPE